MAKANKKSKQLKRGKLGKVEMSKALNAPENMVYKEPSAMRPVNPVR